MAVFAMLLIDEPFVTVKLVLVLSEKCILYVSTSPDVLVFVTLVMARPSVPLSPFAPVAPRMLVVVTCVSSASVIVSV